MAIPVGAASSVTPAPPTAEADDVTASSAQRLYGAEAEGDRTELSGNEVAARANEYEPAAFGSYVHEILATVDLSGADVQPVAVTLARKHGIPDASRTKAIEMIEWVLRLPLMDEARAATRVLREVPLSGLGMKGEVQARVDMLFERAGHWHLVEFKTGEVNAPQAAKARAEQLAAYAASLAGIVASPIRRVTCHVRGPEITEE